MGRLTTNKDVKEMGMYELALNCCYYKNANARYRDFNKDIDARDVVRQLMVAYGKWKSISQDGVDANNELIDDEIFDDTMLENLMYPPTDLEGLIALFYRNIYAMAELREELKVYEDAEEEGLLIKLPCKVGDEFWVIAYRSDVITHVKCSGYTIQEDVTNGIKHKYIWIDSVENPRDYWKLSFDEFKKQCFSTKAEAEQALERLKEGV